MILSLAWLVMLPLAFSLVYLGIELAVGLSPLPDEDGTCIDRQRRVTILVPAHNESAGITQTVSALKATAPTAEILVIADNCDDDTAALARQAGATVAVRDDPSRRGKGYALAFGRDVLEQDPPDAVIVIDADCRLAQGSAERLALRALAHGRPVQASNLLTSDQASPLVAVSNFAMLIKNLVRARGLKRLGGGAMLFGTGMAFGWPLFARLPLATGDAVEDLSLGLWLARQGVPVDLDDRAQVTSSAAPVESSRAQRSRWEHGFLRTAATKGLPLMLEGIVRRSRNLATLGTHLLVPPLALLMLLSIIGLAIAAAAGFWTGHWIPLTVGGSAFAFASAMLLVAWWRYGRAVLPFADLLRIPLYIIWKVPIYIGFFTRNQKDWNRTQR
jgi:cellulose synthase/poly-beta-1,6-N-acetylglucosamine synthase-like glycosyltransferase